MVATVASLRRPSLLNSMLYLPNSAKSCLSRNAQMVLLFLPYLHSLFFVSHSSPIFSGANGSSKNQNNDDGHAQNKTTSKDKGDVRIKDVKEGNTNEQLKELQHMDKSEQQLMESGAIDKKKKKRKRKEVKDLRFEMEVDKTSSQLKKRERKKKYLEAKKKKHKKSHEEEMDFPGQEKIEFGDIVQAPPKLSVPPRAFKNASQERLRLQAIEEYRSRKGWTSRPGNHLPPPFTTMDS
ncbi:hypothetical protein VIGAN_04151700 [Vigna angularis var. angularis]|uniref:Uncharacterized protein n=1 Tax=Vigna angularis var. angularis TaxID=157739 RepID=A0A0S3RUF1_PHAAN|nr:hypothetical protein VIGAN_04151700 [Vigna angularis var. angularis]